MVSSSGSTSLLGQEVYNCRILRRTIRCFADIGREIVQLGRRSLRVN